MENSVHAAKRRQRVYEDWQGNERFFLWGYLVAGPNWKASIGTAMLISAPAGIFLAFVAPYMGLHVHIIILVISCILPVLSVWYLMMTACRDPGIIPRQDPDPEYLNGQKPRTKEVYVNNQRVVIRYNDTCHFYQPPRAHHCSVNDNCIERFDHHCPWVGTTIGLRNYRTFLLFVYTSTVLCLYVFGVCVAMLFVKHDELVDDAKEAGRASDGLWGKAIGKCIPALALMGYTFLFFWFVGGLSVFHAYLVGTNQTTYENFRYNHDNRPNPYSRGVWRNCAEVWCTPIPASKVAFRAYVDEFKPPTGQPYSPYLNGNGNSVNASGGSQGGQDAGAGGSGGGGGAAVVAGGAAVGYGGGGGGYAAGGGLVAADAPQHVAMTQQQYGQQPYQAQYAQDGYGQGGLGGGGAAAYDPAALSPSTAQPYGAGAAYHHPQHHQAYGGGGGGGAYHAGGGVEELDDGRAYSDAGAGWATGGGPDNEPPAQVKGHHTFTSQAGGSVSPGGGPHDHGHHGLQAHHGQHGQHPHPGDAEYYEDEYDEGGSDDGVYDEDEEQVPPQEYGLPGGGGVRPEQVHASLPR